MRRDSGQAMVEACIGMALMGMVLTLAAVFGHMTVNRNRCLIAARHAAWIRGNGGSVPTFNPAVQKAFAQKFFYFPEIARLDENVQRAKTTQIMSGPPLVIPFMKDTMHVMRMTYGLTPAQVGQASMSQLPFPLVYLRSRFDYLNTKAVAQFDKVTTAALIFTMSDVQGECAWFNVSDTWTDPIWVGIGVAKHLELVFDAISDAVG
ncbi:MAG: hypothetical protein K8T26_09200 [Lentisphaerae bacterium]|nr:hypothetical protein [Lentisphaerota bacterium]